MAGLGAGNRSYRALSLTALRVTVAFSAVSSSVSMGKPPRALSVAIKLTACSRRRLRRGGRLDGGWLLFLQPPTESLILLNLNPIVSVPGSCCSARGL